MERTTINTLARTMGGVRFASNKSTAWYQFPMEEKTLSFREKIPYLSLCGGQGPNDGKGWDSPLTVYFDMIREQE